jgi:L-threonylcarbamoyladenylate synthase
LKKFIAAEDASDWLKDGKILIHPTEGIWGIGCAAFNKAAVNKIVNLKQRSRSKSFILLARSAAEAINYFDGISSQQEDYLSKAWPGHLTAVMSAKDNIPSHLKALDNSIAVRVSDHLHLINLLDCFGGLMVSTSANTSNTQTPIDIEEIIKIFSDNDVAVYAHENGEAKKPSTIIDMRTMEFIRE